MKKILISLCLSSLLLASSYEDGVSAYKAKEYEKAVEFFKASKSEYSNVKMQLLWAKSEEALKRNDSAIAAYERVIALEAENLEAAIKLIELYKKDGQDEEASEIAASFDDRDLTPQQRTALSALLTRSYKDLDKFSGLVSAKVGYDSNIALAPSEESLNAFATSLNLTPFQRNSLPSVRGAYYTQALASFSYLHDLTDVGGWFVKTDITGLAQVNFNESLYNTKYLKVSAALGYKISNTTITFPLSYDFTAYLDRDLLQNYTFTPTVSTLLASRYILSFGLKAHQKRYIPKSVSSYDSESYGVLSSLYYFFGGSYVVGKISYENNSARNENRQIFPPKYIDYDVITSSVATKYRMKNGYIINAEYKVSMKEYDENIYLKDSTNAYIWDNKSRKDIYQKLGLGISKNIFDLTKINAKYRYSNNSTNYEILKYNKHNISIGLEYSF